MKMLLALTLALIGLAVQARALATYQRQRIAESIAPIANSESLAEQRGTGSCEEEEDQPESWFD